MVTKITRQIARFAVASLMLLTMITPYIHADEHGHGTPPTPKPPTTIL